MILELADGPKRKSKYITVDAYKRKTTVAAHKRRRPVLNSGDFHVFVPAHLNNGRALWVREDKFDGLSDGEWDTLMEELLNHDPELSDLSSRADRKRRQKERKAKKKEKWERRQKRRDLRTASKAQKRLIKAGAGGEGGSGGSGSESGSGSILDTIINKGTDIVDKVKQATGGGGGNNAPETEGQEGGDGEDNKPQSDDTIFGLPKPVVYVGGAATAAFILYKVLKSK